MNDTATSIATRLLDAHVAHELQQLRSASLPGLIDREVNALFAWLAEVKLDDVVTREQINGVIERYVVDLKISGAFTELAGEMSRLVVSSRLSEHTRVDQVLRPEAFAQFADKLAGLDQLWREMLHRVVQSDAFAALLSSTLQRGVLDALLGAADDPARQRFIDGLLAKLRPMLTQHVVPYVSVYLEKLIKQSVRHSEKRMIVALDVEAVRGLIDEVWDGVAPMKLSHAFSFLGSQDLEDFVVLGYEFWLRYRKTPYFREISRELVDHFFTKYGEESLLALLDDLGVTAAMVNTELHVFLPPLLDRAFEDGFLERRIREHLEPFYRSGAAAAILGDVTR